MAKLFEFDLFSEEDYAAAKFGREKFTYEDPSLLFNDKRLSVVMSS